RSKSELLSETTKSELREIWIKEEFGREKFVQTNAMAKGTIVETDSIQLLQDVTGEVYFKNNEQISNDILIGTPDIKKPLIDIKSSWDIWTFAKVDESYAVKTYIDQLAGYAMILEVNTARIIFALTNTPSSMTEHELYKLSFSMPEEATEKYRNNFVYDDIEPSKRIKSYEFSFSDLDFDEIRNRVPLWRDYLNEMEL
ncbi:hypothetical protein KC614_05105, partial [candidate division WWE3 bacterium]|nr:hypothetical protein [candidate division WWE3 bacterium]